ncbi:MAG: ABC transporter permease [Dehalococcoidia bacterium]|nr:ABC transporter permease [Dehalococcoidia bacterium]
MTAITNLAYEVRVPRWRSIRLPADRRARAGIFILLVLVLLAAAAPVLAGDPVAQDAPARLLAPSWEHPFGTDELRRDLFARTLFGLRTSLGIGLVAVICGASAGATLGFWAGYGPGWLDALAMRLIDAWLAFPGMLAAIAVLTVVGPGMLGVGAALALFNVPSFARLARAQALTQKNKDYVQSARALGAGPGRVVVRHIAVNALPPLLTQLALALSASILIAAALSFLGLGERPPEPSLGGLINASRQHMREAWWYMAFPSAVLGMLMLALTLLADAFGDPPSAGYRPGRRRR